MDPGCQYIFFKNKILHLLKLAEKLTHGTRGQKSTFWSNFVEKIQFLTRTADFFIFKPFFWILRQI